MRTFVIGLVLLSSPVLALGQAYRIEPLGQSSYRSAALAVNEQGQVAGYTQESPGAPLRAIVWSGATSRYLATPQGMASVATDVNERGQAVGWVENLFSSRRQAAAWDEGRLTILPAVSWLFPFDSEAVAVNNAGLIAGNSWHFVSWPGGGFRLVSRAVCWPDLATYEVAPFYDELTSTVGQVNEAGAIVGENSTWDSQKLVFVWRGQSVQQLDLGVPDCTGTDINTGGSVVGWYRFGYDQAFVWTAEHSLTLPRLPGSLGSRARAINDQGLIVGELAYSGSVTAPCLWLDPNDSPITLDRLLGFPSDWQLSTVVDVNNRGQVIGSGWYRGRSTSYIMTPVPEPGSLLVVGLALLLVASRRLR